jgi:hypothetical protein
MSEIPNQIECTINLENITYMVDLLEQGYIPDQKGTPELTEEKYQNYKQKLTSKGIPFDLTFEEAKEKYDKKVLEQYQRGIPLEKAFRNAAQANREATIHVNDFGAKYTSQHGLDNISYSPKLGKKRFSECTNPLPTTIMGTEIWLEKISNFLKQDSEHEGQWTTAVSYPENIPFAIQVLLEYFEAQVLNTGYCTSSNLEMISGRILAQLNQNQNWLDTQPLEPVRNNGTYDDKLRIQRNKKTIKQNRKAEKRKLTVKTLKEAKTYKQLKQEVTNLLNTKTSKHLNLILSRLRTTNQTNTSKEKIISQKSLCLNYLSKAISCLSACGHTFFPKIVSIKLRLMQSLE